MEDTVTVEPTDSYMFRKSFKIDDQRRLKANGEENKKKDLSTDRFQEMKSDMHKVQEVHAVTARKDAATRLTRSEILSKKISGWGESE